MVLMTMCMVATFQMQAQPYTYSTDNVFPTGPIRNTTIVRNWMARFVITCSGSFSYNNTFQMHHHNSQHAQIVGMPGVSNYYGGVHIRIKDMRLFDDKCYFCGSRVFIVGWIAVPNLSGHIVYEPIYDSNAVMGYFGFSVVNDNQIVPDDSLYMYEIKQAKSAQRMAVYSPDDPLTPTAIRMICLHNIEGYSPTCLLEMSNSQSDPNAWIYNVVVPNSANEILTDITRSGNHIVMSSIFSYIDTRVCFRWINDAISYNDSDPTGTKDNLYIYNINNPGTECYLNGFRRLANATPMLYARDSGFIAGIAAEAINASVDPSILLFDMRSPGQMSEYQYVNGGQNLLLKGLSYQTDNRTIGLLYSMLSPSTNDSLYTYLQFPRLGAVSQCNSYVQGRVFYKGGRMQTINAFGSSAVCIGGFSWGGLRPLDGVQKQSDNIIGCMDHDANGTVCRSHTLSPQVERQPMKVLSQGADAERTPPYNLEITTADNINECAM